MRVRGDKTWAPLPGNGSGILLFGEQARADIEVHLGCHVYLGLFVRVRKNWRKDRRVLAELGYRPAGR